MTRISYCIFFIFYLNLIYAQSPVHIFNKNDIRQGVIRSHKGICYAITANHDLADLDLTIIGKNRDQTKGIVVQRLPDQDLAIIKLKDKLVNCNEWNISEINNDLSEQFLEGVISIRNKFGGIENITVDIKGGDNELLVVKTKSSDLKSDELIPGMSGGVLFSNNRDWLGLLQTVNTDDQSATIYQSDNILRLIDSFFPESENFTLESALRIIESATNRKDGANLGQIEAIEYLIGQQYDFKSFDMSGMYLESADFSNGDFEFSKFPFAEINDLKGNGINLNETLLDYVQAVNANLTKANLKNSSSIMLNAQNAIFEQADLSGALFFGADFRNADFTGADLTKTLFSFCDLSGAIFDNALLNQTNIVASILDETTFIDSKFDNVNINGSVSDSFNFTEKQKQAVCRSVYFKNSKSLFEGNIDLFLKVIVKTPTTKYESGYYYETFDIISNAYFPISSGALPFCNKISNDKSKITKYDFPTEWTRAYENSLLNKSNRKNFVKETNSAFLKKFLKNLKTENIYTTPEYEENIERRIKSVQQQIKPNSIPIASSDVLLLAVLKNKVIKPDEVNWEYHANEYLKTKIEDSAWPLAVDYGIPKKDVLSKDWVTKYKDWTLERAKKFNQKFLIRNTASVNGNEYKIKLFPMKGGYRSAELFSREQLESRRLERLYSGNIYFKEQLLASNELFLEHVPYYSFLKFNSYKISPENDKEKLDFGVEYKINEIGIKEYISDKPYLYAKVEPINVYYRSNENKGWKEITNYELMHNWLDKEIPKQELLDLEENIKKIILKSDNSMPSLENAQRLIIELGLNFINSEDINWVNCARDYLRSEQQADNNLINELMPDWKPFFPPSSPKSQDEVPEKWVDYFKDWIIVKSKFKPDYFTLNIRPGNLNLSNNNIITINPPNIDNYWKDKYQKIFEQQKISKKSTESFVPNNISGYKLNNIRYIRISNNNKKVFKFKAEGLPSNFNLRNLQVKIKYKISDIKSSWHDETNIVLVFSEPEIILYKYLKGNWESTTNFDML